MKKKTLFRIILGIILVIALIYAIKAYYDSEKFEYAGTLEVTKIDISSQLSSLITAVNVQEGDKVNINQKVVLLECKDVKLDDELANINFERNQNLFNTGTVSRDTFDQVINTKQASDLRTSWCEMVSPINGTVLTRYHEPGELALPGTKVLTVANVKNIFAYIYVPQPDVAGLKVGEKLVARISELNHQKFIGTIIKINEEAEFTPKNVQTKKERERLVYGVKVSFVGVNDDEILKPGMTIYIDSLTPAQTK